MLFNGARGASLGYVRLAMKKPFKFYGIDDSAVEKIVIPFAHGSRHFQLTRS